MMQRIGLDGGGDFIKIYLSLYDLYATESVSKKRFVRKFKNSGVKKVFVLGIAPKTPENYYTLKKLWLSIGLNSLDCPYTIATDFKLCNILLGLMSHSSIHPCYWYSVDKYHLNKKGTEKTFGSYANFFGVILMLKLINLRPKKTIT